MNTYGLTRAAVSACARWLFAVSVMLGSAGCGSDDLGSDAGFIWPISRSTQPDWLGDSFGPRVSSGSYEFHRGLDIPTPYGSPAYAVVTGVMHAAGQDAYLPDDVAQIAYCPDPDLPPTEEGCPGLLYASYHHLSEITVTTGQSVRQGDTIARTGGDGDNPHLHFEIRSGDDNKEYAVHPLAYLPYEDTSAPDVTLDSVDFTDPDAIQVVASVREVRSELDLSRVEVELVGVADGDSLATQAYDYNEWNLLYGDSGDADINPLAGVDITPEDFDRNSTEQIIHFRFFKLATDRVRDDVRVVVRAFDAAGGVTEIDDGTSG